ncbi:MAG: PASTA domain-containing protein [Firmicutes bacterium]|nr:PASTA domain-containing protein [Bacillota bacterium]
MKNTKSKQINRGRITLGFVLICLLFAALSFRLAKIMIIDSGELTQRAVSQQTRDTTIDAKRGVIYDRNGKELATSSICYTLYAFPQSFKGEKTDDELKADIKSVQKALGIKDSKKKKEISKKLKSKDALVTLAKHLTKKKAEKIRKLKLSGLELTESTQRYYPLGNFASQVLGSVNDDNEGRTGLEYQYNDYLSGVSGRWVTNTDLSGNELVEGTEKHYEAQDGYNLVTTIDEAIQYYCEEAAEKTYKEWSAKKVEVLAMDPKTGEILASVVYPGYDPNDPMKPQGLTTEELKAFDDMTDGEKTEYLSKMWRNPIVSDTYEPGSTFKLITAASALEDKAIDLNSTFYCAHSFRVAEYTLNCWGTAAHGTQTIKEAIANSCNPSLAEVARRLGATKFKQYINLFGFGNITGVDYPGEATAIIQQYVGPVELATMGFGQGISITPLQLVSAISAIGNGGDLVQPHYVRALTDSDGKVVKSFDTKVTRKVLSKKTASEMRDIMEYEVEKGGGSNGKIEGYRIGGKTGTAEKAMNGGYSKTDYYCSFVCLAPMEDPQITLLVVVDTPHKPGVEVFGNTVAAPCARAILKDFFRYRAISASSEVSEKEENSEMVTVPKVKGMTFKEAKAALKEAGLKVSRPDSAKKTDKWEVVDQFPKAGTKVKKGSTVYVYKE